MNFPAFMDGFSIKRNDNQEINIRAAIVSTSANQYAAKPDTPI